MNMVNITMTLFRGSAVRLMWRKWPQLLTLMLTFVMVAPASAHDARPVAVEITETLPGLFHANLKVPPTVAAANHPALIWPSACLDASEAADGSGLMRCESGLTAQVLALEYPQYNPSLTTFFRLELLDGSVFTAMLPPSIPQWQVPAAVRAGQVARDYLLLGIEHIIGGLDHLLFVLGLLVVARTPRRILFTITGFTLAHSITLSLSSLQLLVVPIVPVEATIALSILFLAHEISGHQRESLTWRYPLLVSFGFGLLHGFGFASALGEIGLVPNEVLVSLLFFNLGVEAGQLLFILAVLVLVGLGRRLLPAADFPTASGVLTRRSELLAAYVIGIPSAYWLIERMAGFLF